MLVTVGATSTVIIAPGSVNKTAIILNNSANTMYLEVGAAATTAAGFPIAQNGGSVTIPAEITRQGINGIVAAGSNEARVLFGV